MRIVALLVLGILGGCDGMASSYTLKSLEKSGSGSTAAEAEDEAADEADENGDDPAVDEGHDGHDHDGMPGGCPGPDDTDEADTGEG